MLKKKYLGFSIYEKENFNLPSDLKEKQYLDASLKNINQSNFFYLQKEQKNKIGFFNLFIFNF